MKFKELFDKEFLFESKKEDRKSIKIFYKFDINLKKIEEGADSQQQNAVSEPVDNTAAPAPEATPVAVPVDNTAVPVPTSDISAVPVDNSASFDTANLPLASVVTEADDDKNDVSINDENNIIRKLEGEVLLTKEDIDAVQTIEDIITKLTEEKKNGVNILDEFTADILQVIVNPATQQELKTKIDKESTIFTEIVYGKKRENSVGLRIIKRKNSDLLTTSMMVDNQIINAQYKKETLDKRITDIRNDEYEKDGN